MSEKEENNLEELEGSTKPKKRGRPKKSEVKEEVKEELVEEVTEEVTEEVIEEITEEVTEEVKPLVMNRSRFEAGLNNIPFSIYQNGILIANYSPYLKVTTYDDYFMIFDKKYSYTNVEVKKRDK